MGFSIDDDLVLSSGVRAQYACVRARWTQETALRAVWGACSVGDNQREYRDDAFVFQHDTKAFRVTVVLPESGDTLADATEIVYRIYNPTNDATVINKSLTGGGITLPDVDQVLFSLDTTETGVTPGTYRHEMRITSGGAPATVLTGLFKVVDTVIGD